ncbi:hypothetical protein BDY24DRAFT_390219 [Mrakia frigida]|uniref:uncharacterized protein n=1 Tax=Mrakia frigida TaxID=29902 RepID=UPI003FCC0BDA
MAPPPQQIKQTWTTKVVELPGNGRILCVADIRGDVSELNRLVDETGASAVIMTGDFGLFEPASLERIADKTLKHLITYSPTLSAPLRTKLLSPSLSRPALLPLLAPADGSFPLSQFPKLLNGQLKLKVPTFAVYGACEDVRVVEKFRTGEYMVENLTILDEATTRVVEVGGVRLRLLGLGGAVVVAKMFDNGEGSATIAGGGGTMWTTALQMGELLDTAQRVYDPSETRLLITHSSIGREPLLSLLSLALKADLTISASLHFRYGASFNEFSVQDEGGTAWWAKIARGRTRFLDVWDMVKSQVESVIDSEQKVFLDKALAVINRMPPPPPIPGGPQAEDPAWKNVWSWNLTDSAFGHLLLIVKDGKVASELKSQGFNFSNRVAPSTGATATATTAAPTPSSALPPSSSTSQLQPSSVPSKPPPSGPNSFPSRSSPSQDTNRSPSSLGVKGGPKNGGERPASLSSSSPAASPNNEPRQPSGLPSAPPSVSSGHERNSTSSPISPTSNLFDGGRQKPPRNPHTLFVNQLMPPVTEAEMREFFGAGAAGITRIKFSFDHVTGIQKKFAYVEFIDAPSLDLALNSHCPTLKTSTPRVQLSDPPSASGAGGPPSSLGSASGSGDFSGANGFGGARGMRGGRGGRGARGDFMGNGGRGGGRGGFRGQARGGGAVGTGAVGDGGDGGWGPGVPVASPGAPAGGPGEGKASSPAAPPATAAPAPAAASTPTA